MIDKQAFIRERCTDKFEGIPCSYPDCGCSAKNREEMEAEYEAERKKNE